MVVDFPTNRKYGYKYREPPRSIRRDAPEVCSAASARWSLSHAPGGVTERSNVAALKAARQPLRLSRGFESLPRRSVPGGRVDDAEQRFARPEARDVLLHAARERGLQLRARIRDVRRDQRPRLAPERMAVGQRLGLGDVEQRTSETAFAQCRDESIGVDDRAARHVDQRPCRSEEVELVRSDQALRLGCQGCAEDDVVALGQK